MDAKEIIVLPWIHEMLVDKSAWCYDARHSTCVLRFAFCFGWCIVEELVTDSDMLVEILNQYLQISV